MPTAAAAIALGGLPTRVPMPPMLAEKATPSSTYIQVRRCSSSGSGASRPSASGSIIAAVAVLLIHIDRKAVSQNSQRTARPKLAPARRSTCPAIQRSRPWRCRPAASAKPPRKRKTTGSANCSKASGKASTPLAAASRGTSSAVTLTCKASVSHSQAIVASSASPAPARSGKLSRPHCRPRKSTPATTRLRFRIT